MPSIKLNRYSSFYSVILKAFLTVGFFSAFLLIMLIKLTPKFSDEYSFIVYDKNGNLLNATVSSDEQWRFPPSKNIVKEYIDAAILYEDKNFYSHCGIDSLAVLRALAGNIKAGKTISGASTITMQAVRLSQHKPERTIKQKIKEMLLSLLLELRFSKKEIFEIYAANAPYGGNVIGLETASWRYFKRKSKDLSFAEVATLAVLPNQPSLVRPGVESKLLEKKRNFVLKKALNARCISSEIYELSILESVPEEPKTLPNIIPHYSQFIKSKKVKIHNSKAITNIDINLQERASGIVELHSAYLSNSEVHNAAAIILENKTGNILAYIGNTGLLGKAPPNRKAVNEAVDMVQARRSSGSLLKPFLFAAMLDSGLLLPDQLLKDTPIQIAGYTPKNNTLKYLGAVPASEALTRSLNIPFVHGLREYSISAFLKLLKRLGFSTFTRTADEYGLPLILGGGELTLFEASTAFKNLMLSAINFTSPKNSNPETIVIPKTAYPISSAAARITLEILAGGVRPADEESWQYYASRQKIAWKTGTSYGNKDAWSIGVTPEYTVGVWIGNASGEGRPEIKSGTAAAPLMFKLFELLPKAVWPERKLDDYKTVTVCAHSGCIASQYCDQKNEISIPTTSPLDLPCPYCRAVSLTQDGKYRATANELDTIPKIENRFVLPASQEYYYKKNHRNYKPLPPVLKTGNYADFQILTPANGLKIFIPIELDGSPGALVVKAVHKNPEATIFWDIDGDYLGETCIKHEWNIRAGIGKHRLTLTDNLGNQQVLIFTILSELTP